MPIFPFGTLGSLAGLPRLREPEPTDSYDPLAAIDAIIGVDRRTRVRTPTPEPPPRRTLATPTPTTPEPVTPTLVDPLADIKAFLDTPDPEPPPPAPIVIQGDRRNSAPDVSLPARRADIQLPPPVRTPAKSKPTSKAQDPPIPSLLPEHMPPGQEPVPGFASTGSVFPGPDGTLERLGYRPTPLNPTAKRPEELAADEQRRTEQAHPAQNDADGPVRRRLLIGWAAGGAQQLGVFRRRSVGAVNPEAVLP